MSKITFETQYRRPVKILDMTVFEFLTLLYCVASLNSFISKMTQNGRIFFGKIPKFPCKPKNFWIFEKFLWLYGGTAFWKILFPVLSMKFWHRDHPNWTFGQKWVPLTKNLRALRPKPDLLLARWALGPPKLDFWPKMSAPYEKSQGPQTQTWPFAGPMRYGTAQTGLLI